MQPTTGGNHQMKDFEAAIEERLSKDGLKYGVRVSVRTYRGVYGFFGGWKGTKDDVPKVHYAFFDLDGFAKIYGGDPFWGSKQQAEQLLALVNKKTDIKARCSDPVEY
jgi:ABC-type proline/glycine betaine transport system substrate-binding protein